MDVPLSSSVVPRRRSRRRASKRLYSPTVTQLAPPPDPKKVFVSSTKLDLEPYRDAAALAIISIDWHPVRPTEQGTIHAGPMLKRCVEEVSRSNLFVLILGYRYGWAPRPQDGGNGERSITMIEYEFWKVRERLCGQWPAIVFMATNDDRYLSENDSEELRARQVLFRAAVSRETTVHPFRFLRPDETGHADSIREFVRSLREQLVQAKDRIAERTRVQALRKQAEAQRHVEQMQHRVAQLQEQLSAAQAELSHMRAHQPASAIALLTVGGLIGAGLASR